MRPRDRSLKRHANHRQNDQSDAPNDVQRMAFSRLGPASRAVGVTMNVRGLCDPSCVARRVV